ncbi:MAG TPA: hypothetical protein VJS69_13170 [Candidatus Krumholzibacteria bacterium]|nr:hypothetical protein [Candidatus Krumholzibacteria bacterium]
MATTRPDLIDELLVTRRHAQRLVISLRFQGRDLEADSAEEKEKALTARIDALLAAAMGTWVGQAAELTTRLKAINKRLAASVERVRKRDENAAHIAGALGAIDDAIEVVRRLVP